MHQQHQIDNLKQIVQNEVSKATQAKENEVKTVIEEQSQQLRKLEDHNRCYKETIQFLEDEVARLKAEGTARQSVVRATPAKVMLAKMHDEDEVFDGLPPAGSDDEEVDVPDTERNFTRQGLNFETKQSVLPPKA